MPDTLARLACPALRGYFRHFPVDAGKIWVWDRVVRPYIAWRPFRLRARMAYGAVFEAPLCEAIHTFCYFFGVWEPAVTALISDRLQPGDVFIDIGANRGVHALLASGRVGPAGLVYAIEASPTIFAMLRANLDHNGGTNVVATNIAVSDRAGTIAVYLHDQSNYGCTTIVAPDAANGETRVEMVETRPLGEIVSIEALRRARLIKIDVEGAEWLVLSGMAASLPLLARDVEILVEADPAALARHGASLPDLLALMRAGGFAPFRIAGHSMRACLGRADASLHCVTGAETETLDLVFRRA